MSLAIRVNSDERFAGLSPSTLFLSAYKKAERKNSAMNNEYTNYNSQVVDRDLSLGEDLITGAEQIARELQWKMKDGRWNRRRVYYLAALGEVPIYRVKGLGICARKSALHRFFNTLDERSLNKLNDEGRGQKD